MAEHANGPEVISVTLPSRLELLGVLDRVAQTLCERMEFDEDTCSQVSMSVIEAGTNAVQHGHQRDARLVFETSFHLHADRLEVFVRDRGKGFDVSRVTTDVTSPDHLFDMRGRGIFIMRSCMDEVDYRFGEDGTVCHLTKFRPAASRVADA
jgi:serine/threonine-protein kinase RsbW